MGHYYTQQAEARHFVEMTTRPGELRPTRVTDAKKHGWIPSVTTILDVLNKPALINWKVDQHLIAAWENFDALRTWPKSQDDFIREVKRLAELEMDKAPTAGTDFHKVLEAHFKRELYPPEFEDMCLAVEDSLPDTSADWKSEKRFSHPLGFAGMTDLHSVGWVVDFKTKQTVDKFKPGKMAYPDHHRQLAAYRQGLNMPEARCANVFICLESGEVDFHEHKEEDLQKGWETFCDALSIWKRENYDSSFNQEETP